MPPASPGGSKIRDAATLDTALGSAPMYRSRYDEHSRSEGWTFGVV